MTLFYVLALGLVLLVLAVLLPALLRPSDRLGRPGRPGRPSLSSGVNAEVASNLSLLREQQAQLQAEHASGQLSAAEFEQAQMELAGRLVQEQGALPDPASTQHRHPQHIADSGRTASARSGKTSASSASSTSPARRGTAWVVALLLPAMAAALYWRLGEPEALNPAQSLAAAGPSASSPAALPAGASPSGTDVSMIQVEAMVAQMADRLEKMPPGEATAEGWQMLARSQAALQRFPEADRAYQRAIALAPRNANLLADRADLQMLLQDQRGAEEAAKLIAQALQIDPRLPKALALAGSAAMDKGDVAGALAYWQRARREVPAGSDFANDLDRNVAAAQSQLGAVVQGAQVGQGTGAGPAATVAQAPVPQAAKPAGSAAPSSAFSTSAKPPMGGSMMAGAVPAATGAAPAQSSGGSASSVPVVTGNPASTMVGAAANTALQADKTASSAVSLSGTVQLAPSLQAQVKPGDTLFVYARAAQGPRMPLAILRMPAGRFPTSFTLNDQLAMSADWRLSAVPQVVIEARVSRSGQAMVQSGDLLGRSAVVANRGSGLTVVIDQVQP